MIITNIRIGTTKRIKVILTYNGVELDLTSDTLTYFLKEAETDYDTDALIEQAADVKSQGSKGVAYVTLSATITAELEVGKRYYEILLERGDGTEYVVASGSVYVIGRITDLVAPA